MISFLFLQSCFFVYIVTEYSIWFNQFLFRLRPSTFHLGSRQKMKRLIHNLPKKIGSHIVWKYQFTLSLNINVIWSQLNSPMKCPENQEVYLWCSLPCIRIVTITASFQYFYICLSCKQIHQWREYYQFVPISSFINLIFVRLHYYNKLNRTHCLTVDNLLVCS